MRQQGLGSLPQFESDIKEIIKIPDHDLIMLERQQEDNYRYLTDLYPKIAREALEFIEDFCDQMEYEGSSMFDEYVDRGVLLSMTDRVYDKMQYHEKENVSKQDSMLYHLIYCLLGGEFYHRRNRYHMKKQMFS